MLKIEELKNVVRDLKVEFCKKLIDSRQEMEKEKQKVCKFFTLHSNSC